MAEEIGAWTPVADALPADGVPVETKIDDENGVRNVQSLKRGGRLWFMPDGGMYVYYTPTHWRTAIRARSTAGSGE